jgi:predicted component of type VI protein secretion system
MANEKLELVLNNTGSELNFRTGNLGDLPKIKRNSLSGTITAPASYFKEKYLSPTVDRQTVPFMYHEKDMLLEFSYSEMSIVYNENISTAEGGVTVKGNLSLEPDLKSLKINENHIYSPRELSDKIKMLPSLFEKREEWADLVKNLRNFTVEANRKIEELDDDKGNKTSSAVQTLAASFNLNFNLKCRIFSGLDVVNSFKVEINVDARSKAVELWLESVELKEIIDGLSEEIINKEVEVFRGLVKVPIIQKP